MHTLTYRHAYTGIQTCIHWHTDMHTLAYRHAYTSIQSCIHWHKDMHTLAYRHAYTGKQTCIHWHKDMHTLAYRHAYTGIQTCIHCQKCKHCTVNCHFQPSVLVPPAGPHVVLRETVRYYQKSISDDPKFKIYVFTFHSKSFQTWYFPIRYLGSLLQ
jgi:hypothetical protein